VYSVTTTLPLNQKNRSEKKQKKNKKKKKIPKKIKTNTSLPPPMSQL
jgi:hypothetical protein